jgi:hypothetical protein
VQHEFAAHAALCGTNEMVVASMIYVPPYPTAMYIKNYRTKRKFRLLVSGEDLKSI